MKVFLKYISKLKRAESTGKVSKERLITAVDQVTSNLRRYLEQLEGLKKEKLTEHLQVKCKEFASRVRGKIVQRTLEPSSFLSAGQTLHLVIFET